MANLWKSYISKESKNKKDKKKGFNQAYFDIVAQYSSSNFQSVHLGKVPYFDGTNYTKWAYNMKTHLFGLYPLLWDIANAGVKKPKKGKMAPELAQDYHHNSQDKDHHQFIM